VTKFVGKFRKNKEYNDDYNYTPKRSKNEHAEIKRLLAQELEEKYEIEEASLPQENDKY
jgi:hypothetical protein